MLTGDNGANVLDGGAASDTLDGKGGSDTARDERTNGAVTVDLANRTSSGTSRTDTLLNIENVVGSAYDDTLIGDHLANVLDGGVGKRHGELVGGLGVGDRQPPRLAAPKCRRDGVGTDGYADTLTGDAYSNRLEGCGGDDLLGAALAKIPWTAGQARTWRARRVDRGVTVDLVAGTARGEQTGHADRDRARDRQRDDGTCWAASAPRRSTAAAATTR